jgi:hypothetical protein
MQQILVAAGMAIAVITVGVPFAAIIVVSIASRREEAAHSLSRHAPGAVTQAARRLLAFRSERISARPIGLAPGAARQSVPAGKQLSEVRFGHARCSLPDSGQYSAGDQSQPGSIRTEQRQGAGV